MKSLFILLLSLGFSFGCNNPERNDQKAVAPQENQEDPRVVQIYDKGLNMVMSTVTLPPKWTVQQDIAYDPNTGMPTKYKLVYIGPKNQYIRGYSGQVMYGNMTNNFYEQAIAQSYDHVLAVEQLENLKFSPSELDKTTMEDSQFRSMSERLRSVGSNMEAFKVNFSGQKNWKQYKGIIGFLNIYNQNGGFGLVSPISMLFSPAEFFQGAVEASDKIVESSKQNPEYEKVRLQISYQVQQRQAANSQQQMNQSAAAHRRRMADNKAAFASHQRNMAGLNQIQDVAHENYMKTLRSNGSFSSIGSDYNSHDSYIDQIHERQSFKDPWTENTVNLDGQYQYNFTNGLGDYYRTNDASFDYNSLQGDWKPIESLND